MGKRRWDNASLFVVLGFLVWGAPLAWAFREPASSPQQRPLPTERLEVEDEELPTTGQVEHRQLLAVELPGSLKTERDVTAAVRQYLATYPEWLGGLSLDHLNVHHVATVPSTTTRPAMVYVQFIQVAEGMEVVGTYVDLSVKQLPGRSVLMSGVALVYPHLTLPPARSPSVTSLRQRAATILTLPNVSTNPLMERQRVHAVQGRWRRILEVRFAESPLTAFIDLDNDAAWTKDERLYEEDVVRGTVQGRGILFDPVATGENLPTLNLSNLTLTTTENTSTYSDASGSFTFPDQTTATTVSATLTGRWATVSSSVEPTLSVRGEATPGVPVNLLFNPTGAEEFPTAQVNGYYHTTTIHDWVQAHLPTPLEEINRSLPVMVNLNETCNAYYDRTLISLNFFQAGNGCLNTAFDTIIDHEYGHFVDDQIGGITNSGLSEGWGDTLATYATGQPLIGENFFGSGTYGRTADNTYQYPLDGKDGSHDLAQAWSGFAWDLRNNLITQLGLPEGVHVAEELIIPTFLANSIDIPQAVYDTILLDDDDGTLINGTPHLDTLIDAARRHSLFPLRDLSMADLMLPSTTFSQSQGIATITGTADGSTTIGFQSYQLFYGEGLSPTTWIPVSEPVTTPVINGVLGMWDVSRLPDGAYWVRLVVTTPAGLQFHDSIAVGLEQHPSTAITTDSAEQWYPVVSGDLIAWADERAGNWDIFIYDLKTKKEWQVTDDPATQWKPEIDGKRIVWMDARNGNSDIYFCEYDPQVGCPEQRLTSSLSSEEYPVISGTRIVWEHHDPGYSSQSDIHLYDLAHPEEGERALTTGHFAVTPSISGDHVVWDESNHVWFFDLTTNTIRQITSEDTQWSPQISGDQIVWTDLRNWWYDVYLYNLKTNTETRLTSAEADQWQPDISGSWVVWRDERNDDVGDIYVTEPGTGVEQRLTAHPATQKAPRIDGRRIVWQDKRNGNYDIYFSELPDRPPVLNSVGNQTVKEGERLSFTITGSDPDQEPLTCAAFQLPSWATLDATTCTVSGIPSYLEASTSQLSKVYGDVQLQLCDPQPLCATQTITVTVTDVPPAVITVKDSPDPFSPNGDGNKDTTTIQATLNHSAAWTLQLLNSTGVMVRQFTGSGTSLNQRWDGTDASGKRVPDGLYTYALTLNDFSDTLSFNSLGTVSVDTKPPLVLVLQDSPDPFQPSAGQSTVISFQLTEAGLATLRLYNRAGTLIRTLLTNAPIPPRTTAMVPWNGRDDHGALVPAGLYTYRLWATDLAGNQAAPSPASGTVTVKGR